jgi:DNA-directed RNA polymerase I and III subunit RPAC1
LIAKLRPGQEIEMDLVCIKGTGKIHAKWSPVCTAFYKLKPDVRILKPITGNDAKELKAICPVGVFDIEDLAGGKGKQSIVKASEKCVSCRECLRHEKFADKVDVGKWKDTFEFHVESLGIYTPAEIVTESLGKLKQKASYWLQVLKQNEEQGLMQQD